MTHERYEYHVQQMKSRERDAELKDKALTLVVENNKMIGIATVNGNQFRSVAYLSGNSEADAKTAIRMDFKMKKREWMLEGKI